MIETILERIEKLRTDKKLSLYQISRKAGLSSKTMYNWYNGTAVPTIPALEAIAQVLDVPLYTLFMPDDATAPDNQTVDLLAKWDKLTAAQKDIIMKVIESYL